MILIRLARGAMDRHSALLERSATEMSAFAARAAHELRSPLHTLSLSLALLRASPSQRVLDRDGADVPGASVEIAAAPRGRAVDIVVRDTGPGIPASAVPHIFEPFFRATTRPGGYGLGLATVKRLVDAHGGTVEVASAEGEGTSVTLHLPAAIAAESAPAR